jgi:hypothetical protein
MSAALNNKNRQVEKRLQERFSMHLPVKVSTNSGSGPELQYETITANISSGGAFIRTPNPLPIACKVHLEFLVSFVDLKKLRFVLSLELLRRFEGKPVWVHATGVVIRHENDGMAIIFDDDYQLSPLRGITEAD